MDPHRYQRLRALVHGAAERPAGERRAWLLSEAGDDPALIDEALGLLTPAGPDTHGLLSPAPLGPSSGSQALALPAGTRLGPYTLGAEIGRGGMGVVYEAVGPDPGAPLALKVILPHLLVHPGSRERFLREARLGLRVTDPHVVRTVDAGEAEVGGANLLYLVMERVRGRTLRVLLNTLGPLPEVLVREVAGQAARGLAALHELGIVHRDLKPENLIVTDAQRVRLMDLGVAKSSGDATALTVEGLFVGSPAYAAPEQCAGRQVGPAADLYALGAVLYELLTGRPPFDAREPLALLRAHLEVEPVPVAQRQSGISDFLSAVVGTLLAKAPEQRFVSARALAQTLEEGESGTWWSTRRAGVARAPRARPLPRPLLPLVGRARELTRLREEWESARAGRGLALLVEGEPGAGKTRLVEELLRTLEPQQATVLRSTAGAPGSDDGLVETLVAHLGRAGLSDTLARRLELEPALAEALAAYLERRPPPAGVPPLPSLAAQALLTRLVRRLCEGAPLLWVVEDLHAADPEELRAATLLARATAGRPFLLLLTARGGLAAGPAAALAQTPGFVHLTLERLPQEAVTELLSAVVEDCALGQRLGRALGPRLDGIPLFVLEMVKHLEREGLLRRGADGRWSEGRDLERATPPRELLDLVRARLTALRPPERALLDAAAVDGQEFDPALVARVLGCGVLEVLESLGRLERQHGLVRSGPRRCRFDHPLLHEVVYGDLPAGLRAALHDRMAHAIYESDTRGAPSGEALVRVARHRLAGAEPASSRPLVEQALAHLAASQQAQERLSLARQALEVPGLFVGAARLNLLLEAARSAGLQRRTAWGAAWIAEARALAQGSDDRLADARVALEAGHFALRAADFEAALRESQSARARAEALGDDGLRLGGLRLEARAQMLLGRIDEARRRYEEALAFSARRPDPGATANVRADLAIVLQEQGLWSEAETHQRAAVALLHAAGDRRNEAAASADLGNTLQMAGRMGEALACYGQATALARAVGYLDLEMSIEVNSGELYLRCGDLATARRHLEAAERLAQEVGARREEGYAQHGLGLVAWWTGDRATARHRLEAALALREQIGNRAPLGETLQQLGALDAADGRADDARRRFARALELGRAVDDPSLVTLTLLHLAHLSGLPADAERARKALEANAPRLRHDARLEALERVAALTGGARERAAAAAELALQEARLPPTLAAMFVRHVPYARALHERA